MFEDLIEAGWKVWVNVHGGGSMARRPARLPKNKPTVPDPRRQGGTPIPDLVKRDFTAEAVDQR